MASHRHRKRQQRHPPMAAPPPPELIDDAIAEILLRLPPDDPACLVRAFLVCKLWRRILSDSTFPDRYREFHRTPPLLGCLSSTYSKAGLFFRIATRVPSLQLPFIKYRALDCRHGRILVDSVGCKRESLAVWDPVTGDHRLFRDPDPDAFSRSGVVLCAAAGCNHRACSHGGPFVVVLVSSPWDDTKPISARVYSFDRETSDSWSAPASLQLPQHCKLYTKRGALVGDQIYFLLTGDRILKYDLGQHCLTTICLPCKYTNFRPGILMAMDGGSSLGFAVVKDLSLHLWARKVNPDGSIEWVQDSRVILLNNLDPIIWKEDTIAHVNVIGFAEGVDILLLGEDASGFLFELKSGQFKKLSKPEYHYYDVLPYLSFYNPDFAGHKLPLPAETE